RSTWAQPVPNKRRRRRFRWLRRAFKVCAGLSILLLAAWLYVMHYYAPGLRQEALSVPSLVQDQLTRQGATYTPGSRISPDLQHAIVAIEDRRFYSHPGIDPL